MANLFLTEIPNNAKKSTETIYEIKAPLATFDTIDLDDLDEDNISRKSVKSNDRTPTGGCNKTIGDEKQHVDVTEKVVIVEKVVPVSSSVQKANAKAPVVKDGSLNVKVKKTSDENQTIGAKETKKKTNQVNNKTKEAKVDDKRLSSEVLAEKPKHGVSSVKTKLGKILSPKTDSKKKVGELKLQTPDNGDKKVNFTSPSKLNGNRSAVDDDLDTPTPTEDKSQPDTGSVDTLNSGSENNASGGDSKGDLMDPNSSENNASAEDIQTKLKQKGRKHKEKASNVKYEKIGSLSDISDQEKSENGSSLTASRFKSKAYDSDSDSSDSDSGYIRRGYISNAKGIAPHHLRSIVGGTDHVDSDSTPCSSPKPLRPVVPPPLSKEDATKISKRKAYEKRLQRLQVTTKPIERPRSTTPINIHGFEEYVGISSPERSPAKGSMEKLKIKLPLDDLGRSPRHLAGHRRCASGDGQMFNFNEELLFTHTKSAILLEENGSQTQSPKRILVPPTLSPKLSPAHLVKSPRSASILDPNHPPRYFFNPKSPTVYRKNENTAAIGSVAETKVPNADSSESTNWAKFDDMDSAVKKPEDENKNSEHNDAQNTEYMNKAMKSEKDIYSAFEEKFNDELNKEEILTINIVDNGNSKQCDIECHTKEKDSDELTSKTNINHSAKEIDIDSFEQTNIDENLNEDNVDSIRNTSSSTTCSTGIILDEEINSLC